MGTGITVNFRIKNEECFIRAAILSVLPLAEKVMVYDTGSTDGTLDEVRSIQHPRITLIRLPAMKPVELTKLRNEILARTTTEWAMAVDGDEIYPASAIRCIMEEIPRVPPTIHRIEVHRKHFVNSFNFISPMDRIGRIFRAARIRHGVGDPKAFGSVGHETPYLKDAPQTPWDAYSMTLPAKAYFFHCQYLQRSPLDGQMGRLRGWRKPVFPVMPYFGPWPETLSIEGRVSRQLTSELAGKWLNLNAHSVIRLTVHGQWSIPGFWRLRSWPPKELVEVGESSVIEQALRNGSR